MASVKPGSLAFLVLAFPLFSALACGSGKAPAASLSTSAVPLPSAASPEADPLQGTWSTGSYTSGQAHAAALHAGFSEKQWTTGLKHGTFSFEAKKQGACPPRSAPGGARTFFLRFQGAVLMVIGPDSDSPAADQPRENVGYNGIYRIIDGETFFTTDGTDSLTIRYRIEGRRLTMEVLEENGSNPSGWGALYFFNGLQSAPYFRQG